MKARSFPIAACIGFALLSICSPGFGQITATISGTITDASGAAVAGAKIVVTSPATGASREAVSDNDGHYVVPLLPVGNYAIRVDIKGFRSEEARNVVLQTNEQRELNFTVSPASVQQTVEVSAAPVAVETANPTLGQVITSQQVAELPLNGRDFVQLATLTPGTVQETNPQSFFNGGPSSEVSARGSFSLSVGGSRANSTDWLLDGNDNNELTAGGIAILPSIDAIQEFKVLTYNYSAEYGLRAGPTVLVTTKSGTNQLHGSAFEFFRNTDLDARSFFASYTEQFNLNQFGGSVGLPLKKDKTFLFADIQNKMQRHGIPFTGLVPSTAMRNGDFTEDPFGNPRSGFLINPNVTGAANTAFQCDSAGNPMPANADGSQPAGISCNKIPAGLINSIGQKMINLYPLPNANNAALGYNYVNEPVRKLNEGEFDVRLDENFSSKDSAFARFSYDQANSFVPGGSPGFAEANPFGSNQVILNHGRNVVASETHVFSPNTVNQVIGGYNRIFNYISSQGSYSCISAAFGIPGANLGGVSCGLTSTQLSGGYWSLGDRGFSPFQGGTNVFTIADTLDMVRGQHDLRVGGAIIANQMNVMTEGFQDGYWIYSGAWTGDAEGDLLMGFPSLAIHDQTFDGNVTGRRWKSYRPFIQDNWQVNKSLTLNLGLAYVLTTPITEVFNRQADFNPATATFLIPGQNGVGATAGIQYDKTAFEPRIGVAWKAFGHVNTVIRGGYAIFHDSSWNQGAQGLWQNPPYYAESDQFAFGGGCTFATAACATIYGKTPTAISASSGFPIFTSPPNPSDFTGTIQAQNVNFKLGQVQQYNANLQQQLPGSIVLTVGYAGSRSSHILIDGNNMNVGSPTACGTVSGYTLGCGPGGSAFGVPYTAFPFSTISNISDIGKAHYNSFQVKAETQNDKYGLYALIGYTYARAYDNGFTDGLGSLIGATYYPLPNWPKLDWGLSQINLDNTFTASIIYQLPFGHGKRFGSNWNGAMNQLLGGWQINIIERAISGFPVFIVDSNNLSGVNFQNNGNSLNRPNQTCNPKSGPNSLAEFFNTSCFAAPPSGELGNASRTPLSGPDFVNTDFSAIKNFALPRENMQLQFRTEIFNLFNHAQFGQPGGDINSATFGVINTTVGNPRVIQFALKFLF
ncbi:MAG: carboxypeptidase regulatory-like domain-containing protein [Acidobacteriaceae bacterium]|nr:carboxypeptidase regulatory-like domain-containing protein [Acidobacteriaceae bacterium]